MQSSIHLFKKSLELSRGENKHAQVIQSKKLKPSWGEKTWCHKAVVIKSGFIHPRMESPS